MRLLWLLDSLAVGGAERLAAIFARQAAANGISLHVAVLSVIDGNPLAAELKAAGVPVTVLRARNLRDIAAFRRLLKLLRDERIELIHAHLTYAEIWGRLAGSLSGIPVVSTAHVRRYTNPHDPHPRDRRIEAVVGFVRRHFGGPVIAVSDALRQRLVAGGLPDTRIVTVRNGIETENFKSPSGLDTKALRASLGIPPTVPLILTLAVIREGKGHDLLVAAAPAVLDRIPDAHFLFVGGGPLEDLLRKQIAKAGLADRIHLAGMRSDVARIMATADLFVLPSSQFDSLPTVVMEAMAAGLPVIAFASGGVSEIVAEGETGQVLTRTDPAALADAISALLSDPARAKAMGEAGRARVQSEFGSDIWVERLHLLYRQLTQRGGGAA